MNRHTIQTALMTPEDIASAGFDFLCKARSLKGEAALMALLKSVLLSNQWGMLADGIPLNREVDTVVFELSVPTGRADITVFHADGSASIVEVKDGSSGHRHVLAGIGQVGHYAVELGMSSCRLRKIRRGLLWTSVGDAVIDAKIELSCEQAGVIPMAWGDLRAHMGASRRVMEVTA